MWFLFVPLFLIPPSFALIDCVYGFVGRIQASVGDNFFQVSDTQMCAAALCIKVIIHSAFDDDNVFQQGVSSRCAYTGGDRQACKNANSCYPIVTYDGMRGNFSFCCCKEQNCNTVTEEELSHIYSETQGRKTSFSISPDYLSLLLLLTCGLNLLVFPELFTRYFYVVCILIPP